MIHLPDLSGDSQDIRPSVRVQILHQSIQYFLRPALPDKFAVPKNQNPVAEVQSHIQVMSHCDYGFALIPKPAQHSENLTLI